MQSIAPKRILVSLATGQQGSSVVRALSKLNSQAQSHHPFEIIVVTRNIAGKKAKALSNLPGVLLLQSEYQPEAMFSQASSIGSKGRLYGVFSVQLPGKDEAKLGIKMADEAASMGVKHFMYSSVNFGKLPGKKSDIPHFETKRMIEEHLAKEHPSMVTTTLRPAAFMDNYNNGNDIQGRLFNTVFTSSLKRPLQMIACSDIGHFAALAFADTPKYAGKSIDLAGDCLDAKMASKIYEEVKGKPLPTTYGILGSAVTSFVKEMRTMFAFFNEENGGFNVDIAEVRAQYPQLKTFKDFVKDELSM